MTNDIVSVGAWTSFDRIVLLTEEFTDGATVAATPSPSPDDVYFGDCSINVAAVARSLGATVGLASVVGEDFDSNGYRAHLDRLGIDLSGVVVQTGMTSGWSLNITTPSGLTYCISRLDASLKQSEHSPPEALVEQARWVVINEAFSDYTLTAAKLASSHGIPVAINGMVATAGSLAVEFLETAELLIVNEAESLALEELLEPQNQRPPKMIVTMGANGAAVSEGAKHWTVPPRQGIEVVDTTGAGDAFAAGTVVGLLRGFALNEAARIGSAAASFVIEQVGCQTNLPNWPGIQHRLKESP